MTEARDIEKIVAQIEWWIAPQEFGPGTVPEMRAIDANSAILALIADWRAQKAEVDRLTARDGGAEA